MRVINGKLLALVLFCCSTNLLVVPSSSVNAASYSDTATVCVDAYWDNNGNGIREEGEKFIGGISITLKVEEKTIAGFVTDDDRMKCFTVEPGLYTISMGETGSQAILWTTRHDWDLPMGSSTTAYLDFGVAQIAVGPQATMEGQPDLQLDLFWSRVLGNLFLAFCFVATPIAAISLVVNIRLLKMMRQLKADTPKESHV